MPTNICTPKYLPGSEVTAHNASGATIEGKRLVAVSAAPGTDGNIRVARASLGVRTDGVNKWDLANGAKGALHAEGFVPITSGAAVTGGQQVQSDAEGRVIPLAAADAAIAASLVTGVEGSDNAIEWTAKDAGAGGNDLSVAIVVAGTGTSLSVDVDGDAITVNSATDGGGLASSTADAVKAAVEEHDTASQLVEVADSGDSDGSGVVDAVSPTLLAGGADEGAVGTAIGKACTTVGAAGSDVIVRLY